jgi:hypothetical protein
VVRRTLPFARSFVEEVDRTHTREIRKAQAPQPSAMAFGPLVGGCGAWIFLFFIYHFLIL